MAAYVFEVQGFRHYEGLVAQVVPSTCKLLLVDKLRLD